MCPKDNRFKNQPHVIPEEHPRLLEMKCLRVESYNLNIVKLCSDCYKEAHEPTFFKQNIQHALFLSDPYIPRSFCYNCESALYQIENALSCNDCFRSYFNILDYLRSYDHNPRDLRHAYYDVLKEKLIRFTIVSESPEENAVYIHQRMS